MMNPHVAELNWTDEQWSRVCKAVSEEAQRTRVAAKFLPIYGPVDPKELAVPNIELGQQAAPLVPPPPVPPPVPPVPLANQRLVVNSLPFTVLARISVLVYVRSHEMADPELQAATLMFRRAANVIARTEDALMFNGQNAANVPPFLPPGLATPPIVQISGGLTQFGMLGQATPPAPAGFGLRPGIAGPFVPPPPLLPRSAPGWAFQRAAPQPAVVGPGPAGVAMVNTVVDAINDLEQAGYSGPYACVLANDLYSAVHIPTPNLVLPRHTILPLLEGGPLLRSSTIQNGWGLVVSYDSGQVDQVLASDITVKFLQVSEEPRFVFRVAERVALRVKDWQAIVNLHP